MKNLFFLILMVIFSISLKAQAYGLTIEDLIDVYKAEPNITKNTLTAHGFQKSTGNLWLYKTQSPFRKSTFNKDEDHVQYLFFGGQSFFVASHDASFRAMFFSFDIKHLGYYLNWFGAMGYCGLEGKMDMYITGNPDDLETTAQIKLTSEKIDEIEVKIIVWKDRCQLSMINKL